MPFYYFRCTECKALGDLFMSSIPDNPLESFKDRRPSTGEDCDHNWVQTYSFAVGEVEGCGGSPARGSL